MIFWKLSILNGSTKASQIYRIVILFDLFMSAFFYLSTTLGMILNVDNHPIKTLNRTKESLSTLVTLIKIKT